MQSEQQRLNQEIHSLEQQIQKLPAGKLIFVHNGKYYKWFHSNEQNTSYIPKRNRTLAEQLAIKNYLSHTLEAYKKEQRAIQAYLDYHADYHDTDSFLDSTSDYYELLSPYFTPLSKELADWMSAPYDSLTQYPEQRIHKASAGKYVRSKSEAMIDMILHINNIPFRYECALQLDEITIFPDFTIRHPKNGELFYWEHFGLMDNPNYAKNAHSKLQLYTAHNIIPSIHLITTYETQEHPLSIDTIHKIVEHYFL